MKNFNFKFNLVIEATISFLVFVGFCQIIVSYILAFMGYSFCYFLLANICGAIMMLGRSILKVIAEKVDINIEAKTPGV